MNENDGDNSDRRPDALPIPIPAEMQWEFYTKTKFGNNVYIGYNPDTKKYRACSDKSPMFCVPEEKMLSRIEEQIKFMLEYYDKYLKEKS